MLCNHQNYHHSGALKLLHHPRRRVHGFPRSPQSSLWMTYSGLFTHMGSYKMQPAGTGLSLSTVLSRFITAACINSLFHLWLNNTPLRGCNTFCFSVYLLVDTWLASGALCLVAKSCPTLCDPMVAYQAPLSIRFSRQEYWSGLPFPSP